jgi:type IV pilus biogenesis protein CpaD/CtpE
MPGDGMKKVAVAFLLSLVGCASVNHSTTPAIAKVTYYSEPIGAAIYEGNKLLGYAPRDRHLQAIRVPG